jgi:hypothetical protein
VLGKLESYGDRVGLQDQFERERDAAQERQRLAEATTQFTTTQQEAAVEAARRADELTTAQLEAAYQNRELTAREYYAQLEQLQRAATERELTELNRQLTVARSAQAERTQGTMEYLQGQEAIFAIEQKLSQTRDQAAQRAQANQLALTAATREQTQALAEQLHQVRVRLLEMQADGPKFSDIVVPPEQRELFQARLAVLEDQSKEFIARLRQAGDHAGLLQVRELITAEALRDMQDKTDQMTQFGIQAARNIQTAFADFLFDPFKDGLRGMARGFLDTVRRMAANAAAASIMRGVLGENFEKGEIGGWLGGIIGSVRGERTATPYPKGSVPDNQQVGPPVPSTVGRTVATRGATVDPTSFDGILGAFKTGFEQIFNGDFFGGLGTIFQEGFGGIVQGISDLLGSLMGDSSDGGSGSSSVVGIVASLFGGGGAAGSAGSSSGGGGAAAGAASGVSDALYGIGDFFGSLFHTGGLVGGNATKRALPAIAFAGAPRYHAGGLAGLKPNEIPAILMGGPKGMREEVLTAADPRHRDNLPFDSAQGTGRGGQARPAPAASMESTVNVVNVLDPSLLGQYLSTKAGEKLVMNVMSRNSGALQKLVNRG